MHVKCTSGPNLSKPQIRFHKKSPLHDFIKQTLVKFFFSNKVQRVVKFLPNMTKSTKSVLYARSTDRIAEIVKWAYRQLLFSNYARTILWNETMKLGLIHEQWTPGKGLTQKYLKCLSRSADMNWALSCLSTYFVAMFSTVTIGQELYGS